MAYRKDFLQADLREPDFESSAHNSSNPRNLEAFTAIAAPIGTSITLTHASGSRAPITNLLSTSNDTMKARHSYPFQHTPQSPGSKLQPFLSTLKEGGETTSAKRFSLGGF